MAKTKGGAAARDRSKKTKLRWRLTRISYWRKAAGMTQQQVADHLATVGIELDRVSIGRIEKGTQMPAIEALEAMASRFGTDVDSMLNMTPEEAAAILEFKSLQPHERRRALQAYRAAHGEAE